MTDESGEIEAVLMEGENRFKRWVLLTGGRITVMLALMAGTFAFIVLLAVIRPVDVERLLSETDSARQLFLALLSGAILLVSVVVSINSVVLSEEIADIESQQRRLDASIDYRQRLGELVAEDVTPARPAEFLRVILHVIYTRTQRLQELATEEGDADFQTDVEPFVTDVLVQVGQARATLANTRSGTFGVLLVGLRYDHSEQLRALRIVDRTYGGELTDEQREVIDDLVQTLKFLATGREYFKSIYYKQELARLSSRLLYVSLPSIVVISYVILSLDTELVPDVTLFTLSPLLVFVAVAYTVALAPYIVLTAYVLRATTVTLRTVAAGPFILSGGVEEQGREAVATSLEWDAFGDDEAADEE
jgi:hypothetical protein